ncbi:MAG: Maf family protein [Ignavibacteria bacterium]|jgi:septum formation protein
MINSYPQIYLASKSPRRRKLLKQLNLEFKCFSVDINEVIKKNEKPYLSVKRLSKEKMDKARQLVDQGIIITADTIVVLNGKQIGKPKNKADAKRILRKLSGKVHTVYTGFSIYNTIRDKSITDYEKTLVEFRNLSDKEIDDYIKTGSPLDKAGAYGIQDDFGAVFIKKITGCYYNVVGLPLTKVYQSLLKMK